MGGCIRQGSHACRLRREESGLSDLGRWYSCVILGSMQGEYGGGWEPNRYRQ